MMVIICIDYSICWTLAGFLGVCACVGGGLYVCVCVCVCACVCASVCCFPAGKGVTLEQVGLSEDFPSFLSAKFALSSPSCLKYEKMKREKQ